MIPVTPTRRNSGSSNARAGVSHVVETPCSRAVRRDHRRSHDGRLVSTYVASWCPRSFGTLPVSRLSLYRFSPVGRVSRGLKPASPRLPMGSRVTSVLPGQGGAAVDEDLSRFCCQNPDCPDHGQRGLGNLT